MNIVERGPTFGSALVAARKTRFVTQNQLLQRNPALARLIDLRTLNELEQDRLDPRALMHFDEIVQSLANSLDLDEGELRKLAADYPRAFACQQEFQARLAQEAVAFRARMDRG